MALGKHPQHKEAARLKIRDGEVRNSAGMSEGAARLRRSVKRRRAEREAKPLEADTKYENTSQDRGDVTSRDRPLPPKVAERSLNMSEAMAETLAAALHG